jgi:poly(A) polymerase
MLKRFISKFTKSADNSNHQADIIAHTDHAINPDRVSENAVKVLERLQRANYSAYLVGGGVRDILLGQSPKDFDIVTDATPEEVHGLFRNSRLIGRRFRLVHVVYGRDVIEVATMRGNHDNAKGKHQSKKSDSGMLLRDNVYGTIDEDAIRRDFTINALYYDISDRTVHSYAGGMQDLKKRRLRLIGDPATRYREDPVRMLRAIRFAAKLDFSIESKTAAPIKELAPLLLDIPAARLFEEVLKLFMAGYAHKTFALLEKYNLFSQLFPHTQQCIDENEQYRNMVNFALINSDQRVAQGKSLTPAFLYSVFLWPCLLETARTLRKQGVPDVPAMHQAATEVIGNQQAHTSIPKRFTIPMKEIWELQRRLERRQPRQLDSIIGHSRFRAAYDFVLLREQNGEKLDNAGLWWTDYQEQHPEALYQKPERPRYNRNRSRNRSDDAPHRISKGRPSSAPSGGDRDGPHRVSQPSDDTPHRVSKRPRKPNRD